MEYSAGRIIEHIASTIAGIASIFSCVYLALRSWQKA
jgi:hypothetical protein